MYYLAYGSNLHPQRLSLRVPNCRLVGTTILSGYRLTFNKRSTDGSSKCHLDFTGNPEHVAHAVVYEVPQNEIRTLDYAEGLGSGYFKEQITVTINDEPFLSFVYLASQSHITATLEPYHWYKGFVLAGAGRHQFPVEYVQQIAAVVSMPDHNGTRRAEMETLLALLEA